MQDLLLGIDGDCFRHQDGADVVLPMQDRANRLGNIRRGERRGCDLIEQGLERVMIAAIHNDDLDWSILQRLHNAQSAEPGPNHHHAWLFGCCRHLSSSSNQEPPRQFT